MSTFLFYTKNLSAMLQLLFKKVFVLNEVKKSTSGLTAKVKVMT